MTNVTQMYKYHMYHTTNVYLLTKTAGAAIRGKTSDLTVVDETIIDTLHKEGKAQKVIAEKAGCSQSSVSKHLKGTLSGRAKCGRKRCTSKRDDPASGKP